MAKKTIDEIVEEKYTTFANMMKDIKTSEELNKNFVVYLRQKEQTIITKARDEELIRLKAKQAEISKPYTQTLSALKKMSEAIYKFGHKFEDSLKEEFEKSLVGYARQSAFVKAEKEEDEELNAIKETIKEINEDYNPTIQALTLKCDYISFLLRTRFTTDAPKVEI